MPCLLYIRIRCAIWRHKLDHNTILSCLFLVSLKVVLNKKIESYSVIQVLRCSNNNITHDKGLYYLVKEYSFLGDLNKSFHCGLGNDSTVYCVGEEVILGDVVSAN